VSVFLVVVFVACVVDEIDRIKTYGRRRKRWK
jgi:hypothetical protein